MGPGARPSAQQMLSGEGWGLCSRAVLVASQKRKLSGIPGRYRGTGDTVQVLECGEGLSRHLLWVASARRLVFRDPTCSVELWGRSAGCAPSSQACGSPSVHTDTKACASPAWGRGSCVVRWCLLPSMVSLNRASCDPSCHHSGKGSAGCLGGGPRGVLVASGWSETSLG